MSAPPPKRPLVHNNHQPVLDLAAKPATASTRSTPPLADLPTEPGQTALGPTADNDLDLLRRHLDETLSACTGETEPKP
jgi:hypothetical protein